MREKFKQYSSWITHTLLGIEKKAPQLDIELSPLAKEKIAYLLSLSNPYLSEHPFLGIGTLEVITDVAISEEQDRGGQGLFRDNNGMYQSTVDTSEMLSLWNKVYLAGLIDQVVLFGHTHPTGRMKVGNISYNVTKSESMVDPSVGDVKFFKSFLALNPALNFPLIGIAANIHSGPALRMFSLPELTQMKRYRDILSVPQRTIEL